MREAGEASRRGTATFGAFFKGTSDGSFGSMNFGAVNTIWSLGLQETGPGIWKVNRITPVQVPGDGLYIPGGRRQGPSVSGPGDDGRWPRMPTRMYRP